MRIPASSVAAAALLESRYPLLQVITPYLRSLVRRWHKDPWDLEDTVQDILLNTHSIRHTYDPSRPFGPWLVGIAKRHAIDRLRRVGVRCRARRRSRALRNLVVSGNSELIAN